ncbi:cyclic nucleotide-binding domain-containing protein [Mucilaginibacter yixingensis]|nr:cyclic nucleotide-binding domain-containing protein [Mucilaginibacter yixingensis]
MKTEFESYLRSETALSAAEIRLISDCADTRKLHRNEALLTPGEVCRHKVFIAKGMLRTYSVKEDGSEHILQFSPEHTWTLDAESYDTQTPSRYYISAIENSEVLLWTRNDFLRLLSELPLLKKYADHIVSRTMHSTRQRLHTTLSGTPEEKYDDFVQHYPNLLTRLPLRMIAAYLGISLKTLTRLRSAQLQRS